MAQMRIINLPIALEFRPRKVLYERKGFGDSAFFFGRESTNQPNRVQDPWRMRDELFRLREGDNAALLQFLSEWGQWYAWKGAFGLSHGMQPAKIWEERRSFRNALSGTLETWLTEPGNEFSALRPRPGHPPYFSALRPRPGYPPYLLSLRDCGEAIRATITIDLLDRVKFRICARPDCGAPYAVESNHPRKYCTQYCGHIVSLRRKRSEAKQRTAAKPQRARERGKGRY
jgi:hypothetical protein